MSKAPTATGAPVGPTKALVGKMLASIALVYSSSTPSTPPGAVICCDVRNWASEGAKPRQICCAWLTLQGWLGGCCAVTLYARLATPEPSKMSSCTIKKGMFEFG